MIDLSLNVGVLSHCWIIKNLNASPIHVRYLIDIDVYALT